MDVPEKPSLPLADKLGLRCLWPLESCGPTQAGNHDYHADIVLVHGLDGGSVTSFVHPTRAFWPMWLASDIPNIRILTFGYPAHDIYLSHPGQDASTHTYGRIFTFAESLLSALKDSRRLSTAPIIFIAHGIGGIVVKRALVYSLQRRAIYGDIAQNVRHVIFLDTPHSGYDLSTWTGIFGGLANERAEAEFGLWSPQLADLTGTFSEIGNKITITSCYASEPTVASDGEHQFVRESSVRLGYQSEVLLLLPRVCHSTMCKFADKDDHNYRTIRQRLVTEIHNFILEGTGSATTPQVVNENDLLSQAIGQAAISQLQSINERLTSNNAKLEKLCTDQKAVVVSATKNDEGRELAEKRISRKKILKWLYSPKQGIDYEAVLSTELKGSANTCSWIEIDPIFRKWRDSSVSRILWLHGIQGCGKSTLLSWLIQDFRAQSKHVFFFHCKADTVRSGVYVLSCLAHQMAAKTDIIPDALVSRYETSTYATVSTMPTAIAVLKEIADVYNTCYIFIDALDECGDRHSLITALLEVADQVPSKFRIFCSSRNELDIERLLKTNSIVDDLEMTQDKIQKSINCFIETSVRSSEDLVEKLQGHPQAQGFVLDQLILGSQGMFLLPKFMLQDLALKGTFDEIKDFLNVLPSGLPDYYLKILTRLDPIYHRLAKQVILWAVWAKRPLSLEEMAEIFAQEGSRYLSLQTDIKKALGCLISFEEGRVRCSHSSVKRFFLNALRLRDHPISASLLVHEPCCVLADTCARYVLTKTHKWPKPTQRFLPSQTSRIRNSCPFMEYASVYWLAHCREAPNPLRYIGDVKEFVNSPALLRWYEAICLFVHHERPTSLLRHFRQWLLQLSQLLGYDSAYLDMSVAHAQMLVADLNHIKSRLARLWDFAQQWESSTIIYPDEIFNLAPMISSPHRSVHETKQSFLSTRKQLRAGSRQIFNLLDRRQLGREYDRFMLSDLNILQWQSLMPSSATDNMVAARYDPRRSGIIQLLSQSIENGNSSLREGIDPAEIGAITNTAILRRDLRAVAITWARYLEDKSRTLEVKTYAWDLEEDSVSYLLQRIEWTDIPDPCRVDMTISNAFRLSKGPVAFSDDLRTLWTPGGGYNMANGVKEPPPAVFYDSKIQSMTYSRDARIVAGIRSPQSLEVYSIPDGELLTCWSGKASMLGVSPKGSFTLFVETSSNPQTGNNGTKEEVVTLLDLGGKCSKLWSWHPSEGGVEKQSEVPSLEYFHNNGGLHAFSDNEVILVLCVPTAPEWQLLAFDLSATDIPGSQWTVDHSGLLGGASILSLSFCPIHERRLYVLDSFGIMRAVEISRASTTSIITTDPDENPPVVAAISRRTRSMLTASVKDMFDNGIEMEMWDLSKLSRMPCAITTPAFLWSILQIRSQELIVNLDSAIDTLKQPRSFQPQTEDWQFLGRSIQATIDKVLKELKETTEDGGTSVEAERYDITPRVMTQIDFTSTASYCFALSLIYFPLPSINGQAMWDVSMIMETRQVDTPCGSPFSLMNAATVGSPYEEHLCMAFHEPSSTLAFAMSIKYFDKSDQANGVRFYVSKLCILGHFQSSSKLACKQAWEDGATRFILVGMYIPMVASLHFSDCGTYLYGFSTSWPSSVLQIDARVGRITRTIYDPFNSDGRLTTVSLTTYGGDVFAVAVDISRVLICRLPFRLEARFELAVLALGPLDIGRRTQLEILWPQNVDEDVVVVAKDKNFLRRREEPGTSAMWPIVLAFKERDMGEWILMQERDPPVTAGEADEEIEDTSKRVQVKQASQVRALRDWVNPTSVMLGLVFITCAVMGLRRLRAIHE